MLRRHLSYANLTASLALFIALGGVSYAAAIAPANSVRSSSIRNGEVKTADLGTSAVTSAKLRDGTLAGADLSPALRADLNDAATVGGRSAAQLGGGASDARVARGSRTFTGASPAPTATTVSLSLPAGIWVLHFDAHALAQSLDLDDDMSVTFSGVAGTRSLGDDTITLNTEFGVGAQLQSARTWSRTVLVRLAAPRIITLRTSAVANAGEWGASGPSLKIDRASIVAEKSGGGSGAQVIP